MQKFGINTSIQFKVVYLNAAMESNMVPKVKGGMAAKEMAAISRNVSVNKREPL